MAGSSHFTAICKVTIIPIDKVGSDPIELGAGTSYPFVTSVEIQRVYQRVSAVNISIEAPFEEGREILNSNMLLCGNKAVVSIRYPDDDKAHLEASGVISKGGVGLSITPNGLSGTIAVKGTSLSADYIKPIVLKGAAKTSEWLEKVVSEAGYKRLVISKRVKGLIDECEVQRNDTLAVLDYLDDWCSLNGFMWREIYDEGNLTSIIIFDEEETDKNKVSRVFVMRNSFIDTSYLSEIDFISAVGAESATAYPIISFSPELKQGFFANRETVKTKQVGITGDGKREDLSEDEVSIKTVKKGSNSKDTNVGGEDASADKTTTIKKLSDKEAGEVLSPIYRESTNRKADEKRLERLAAQRMVSYNANLTTFGIPEMEPGERIAVVGLGRLLDGIFTCKEVTQTWSAGKIETSIGIYNRNNGVDEV